MAWIYRGSGLIGINQQDRDFAKHCTWLFTVLTVRVSWRLEVPPDPVRFDTMTFSSWSHLTLKCRIFDMYNKYWSRVSNAYFIFNFFLTNNNNKGHEAMVWIRMRKNINYQWWHMILLLNGERDRLHDVWFDYQMQEASYMTHDYITKCKRPITWRMMPVT